MAVALVAAPGGIALSLRRGLLWGAAGFVLAAMVLKPLSIAVLGLPATPVAFVVAATLSVGVLEEGTRAGLLLALRRPGGPGLAGLALGWALAELLLVGVAGLAQLLVIARDPLVLAAAREHLPPMAADALQRQVASLSAWTAIAWPVERAAAMVLQIGFTALIAAGLARRGVGRAAALPGVMLLHAAVDVPAAGFQAGLWPLAPVQVACAAVGLALAPWAWRWSRDRLSPTRAATSG